MIVDDNEDTLANYENVQRCTCTQSHIFCTYVRILEFFKIWSNDSHVTHKKELKEPSIIRKCLTNTG